MWPHRNKSGCAFFLTQSDLTLQWYLRDKEGCLGLQVGFRNKDLKWFLWKWCLNLKGGGGGSHNLPQAFSSFSWVLVSLNLYSWGDESKVSVTQKVTMAKFMPNVPGWEILEFSFTFCQDTHKYNWPCWFRPFEVSHLITAFVHLTLWDIKSQL